MTHLLHEFHAEYAWLSPCTVHLKLSQHNCANWLLFYHLKEKVKKKQKNGRSIFQGLDMEHYQSHQITRAPS